MERSQIAGTTGLPPGTLLGQRFVIDAEVGAGGMGAVYRGQDLLTGKTVAIKLPHAGEGSPQGAGRFAREVEILAELRHPGIVSYIAHGMLERGQPFLAMEWLSGEDLSQHLRRGGAMSLPESLRLVTRVAEALYFAHQQNIIHRDLKPSNVLPA